MDTTSRARLGGRYNAIGTDQPTLDSLAFSGATLWPYTGLVYSRLFMFKRGIGTAANGDIVGDVVESYEAVDGGSEITLRLRGDARFDSRPPTSGRVVNSSDVTFSWDKFSQASPSRTDLVNSLNDNAPVSRVRALDRNTATVGLAFPLAYATRLLAQGFLQIQPTEAGQRTGFDPRNDMRGSGPFRLKQYERSVSWEYERNADWHIKGQPFLTEYVQHILPDYPQRLAQFRAGRLEASAVAQSDVLQTAREIPQLELLEGQFTPTYRSIIFGIAGESPFRDVRVRRAISLMLARNQLDDFIYDLSRFKDEGLPASNAWCGFGLTAAWGDYWVDPSRGQRDEMGSAARWFRYDPKEANQLLAASGYQDGFDVDVPIPEGDELGGSYREQVEVTLGMLREGGLRPHVKLLNYGREWLPNVFFSKGSFSGLSLTSFATYVDPGDQLFNLLHEDAARAPWPKGTIPAALNELLVTQRSVFDGARRQELIREIQRSFAELMPSVPWFGSARGFQLSWPWVRNVGVFQAWPGGLSQSEITPVIWIDERKRSKDKET